LLLANIDTFKKKFLILLKIKLANWLKFNILKTILLQYKAVILFNNKYYICPC